MKYSSTCKEWLNSLPAAQGYLRQEQIKGRELLLKLGMPTKRDEAWRLCNLNRLNSFLSLPVNHTISDYSANTNFNFPKKETNRTRIIINSNSEQLKNNILPKGITQLNQDEIDKYLGQIVKVSNIKYDLGVFLNQAINSDLLALKINKNASESLEIIFPSLEQNTSSNRIILILEEGSKLDLLQVFLGKNNSAQNHLIEVKIETQAELTHGLISMGEGSESSSICTVVVDQSEKSKYSLNSLHHGWHYARFEPRVIQTKGHASTKIKCLQVTKSKEQIATHSLIKFEGPNGKLDQIQKAVATEASHCIFNGSIKVPQKAQKTEAAQLSRNLLLSKRARIDTKPELEIIADDVKCTHGATISQIQDEELFYLLSRGIDNEHANSLLLKGFYDEVISNFSKSASKWNFLKKLIIDIKK